MKKIIILSSIFFIIYFLNCATEKKIEAGEKKVVKITAPKEKPFNGIIEDFENDLRYWSTKAEVPNLASLLIKPQKIDNKKINNIGILKFKVGFSREYYSPKFPVFIYLRKMNFSKYNGVQFSAKGTSDVVYKFKILEVENYESDRNIKEIWFSEFRVSDNWQEFRLPFSRMEVEEYWEQDYVSDNRQIFTNIAGIEISVQNNSIPSFINGTLYIDNIKLYK